MLYFFIVLYIEVLFLLSIWPLDPISKGIFSADHPLFFKSLARSMYLLVFLKFAAFAFFSKLTVSSNRAIFFSDLLIITMSGLWPVTNMSCAMYLHLWSDQVYLCKL